MNKIHKSKLNNNGSTTVFVIVALMFIGLLATLILALSAASFKMRNVDYQSRQNFYAGEEYSGRIYSGLGMNAVGILGEAYVETMGKMNSGLIMSEKELNDYIKKVYFRDMLIYLRLIPNTTKLEDVAKEYKFSASDSKVIGADGIEEVLSKLADPTGAVKVYIDNAADATDDKNVKVTCNLEGGVASDGDKIPVITIHDVHLNYVNDKNDFESNYTFDVVITYPEWDFTYANPVSASIDIDTFLDYVVISNDYIKFDDVTSTVNGCISTGTNHMVADNSKDKGLIIDKADVEFNENSKNRYEQLAIVATDNILINGTAFNGASMKVNNGSIWCNSVVLDRATTNNQMVTEGSVFTTSGTKLYVQDDIQLDGDYSSVSISGGTYYGYGMTISDSNYIAHNSSSAIIVNGNNSVINLKDIKKLVVNGLGYLNFGTANYKTGESLAVRGIQDAYLVPSAYMGGTQSNPVRAGIGVDLAGIYNSLVGAKSTFFGKDYLNQSIPCIPRQYTINGREYTFYYLNFKSYKEEREYVTEVLNTKAGDDKVKKDIQERIYKNLSEMNGDPSAILNVEGIGDGHTAGAIVTANGGVMLGSASASELVGLTLDQSTTINRYLLMKSLLLPVCGGNSLDSEPLMPYEKAFTAVECEDIEYKRVAGDTKFPEIKDKTDNTRAIVNTYLNRTAFDNFVNINKLTLYAAGETGGIWQRVHTTSVGTATITYATWTGTNGSASGVSITDGVVYVDSGYVGLVVTDAPVVVEGNVTGLILTSDGVTISGTGTLTSSPELIDELMKREQSKDKDACHSELKPVERRSDVLKFYPIEYAPDTAGQEIEQLNYSDVIYIDNWRKYNDTRFVGEVLP